MALGAIKAGIGPADHRFGRFAGGELGHSDGDGDGAQHIAGGFLHQLAALHRDADLVGDMGGVGQGGAAQ